MIECCSHRGMRSHRSGQHEGQGTNEIIFNSSSGESNRRGSLIPCEFDSHSLSHSDSIIDARKVSMAVLFT
jgi:hypothetical protein